MTTGRRILLVLIIVGLCLAGAAFWIYRASQVVPDFYAKAQIQSRAAAQQMTRESAALAGQARRTGSWQAQFTVEQINAWFAIDLVEQQPDLLPSGVTEPRVAFAGQNILFGCRWQRAGLSSVVWLEVEPRLVKTNELSLRIRKARAGNLPVPLGDIIAAVTRAANDAGLRVEQRQVESDPLLTFSAIPGGKMQGTFIDSLEIRGDTLIIVGHTERKTS